jgi:hypothetical protein
MQVNLLSGCVLSCLILAAWDSVAVAEPCACNSDVSNLGGVGINIIDVAVVRDCINGICGQCVNSCDVDCDGDVDYYDAGVVSCAFNGNPNCCAEVDGACTGANNATPPCVVTTDDYCSVFSGTWHSDLSICQGDTAIDIPAASTWGMAALTLSTLIAATIVLQRQRQVRPT